jgi:transcriptional regulator with XRE-family HTH domain
LFERWYVIMETVNMGPKISELRKAAGMTQEALAKSVGVSAQAVSKWENGGLPDVELLPRIADSFGVSVDLLYGREGYGFEDAKRAIMQTIADAGSEERYRVIFELCWDMERALFGVAEPKDGSVGEYERELKSDGQIYSSCMSDAGFTRMGIANRLQYFLIVPEPENKASAFFNGVDYVGLFRELADEKFFQAVLLLDGRPAENAFTARLLVTELGIDSQKAKEIISALLKYKLVRMTLVELDDTTQEIYYYCPTPSFAAMLIFARELIDSPRSFSYFSGGRNRPYLK